MPWTVVLGCPRTGAFGKDTKSHLHRLFSGSRHGSEGGGVQSLRFSVTPQTAGRQASPSITISRSSLKLVSTESVMPSNPLILCRPLLFLPSILPSIRVFSNESVLHIRWPEYWSFSFNISPSNEHSVDFLRIDWFDLLAVQGTLKSLLQHHSLKASVLRCSAFFMAQLSHPYVTTGKTTALTIRPFVGRVMTLLLNMLVWLCHGFSSREQVPFNFMAAITICSDFGTRENKFCGGISRPPGLWAPF